MRVLGERIVIGGRSVPSDDCLLSPRVLNGRVIQSFKRKA